MSTYTLAPSYSFPAPYSSRNIHAAVVKKLKNAGEALFSRTQHHLLSPDAILSVGWDKLVRLLDHAHYVRYDFSTATKLLEISQELKDHHGTVTNLVAQAKTSRELSAKLQEFKNIGPITARIFVREVRAHWYHSRAPSKRK